MDNFDFTDLGNARRLIAAYGSKIRYCAEWDAWMLRTNSGWTINPIDHLARRVAFAIGSEALGTPDTPSGHSLRNRIRRHAAYSETSRGICRMLEAAKDVATLLTEADIGVPIAHFTSRQRLALKGKR